MVNGINSTSTSYWLQLLSSQKNQSSSGSSLGLAGMMDSAEISGQGFGVSGAAGRTNPLESLVTDGAITQEQATAIDGALRSGKPGDGNDNPLASLIADGAITQEQADSVKSTLDAGRPRDFMSGILDNLVSDGTLTQEQADAVSGSMKQQGMQGMPPPPPPEESSSSSEDSYSATDLANMSIDEVLKLLSSGQITAQEALEAIQNDSEDSTAAASASATAQRSQPADPLDSLVSSGVITQDQQDAIKSAFRTAMDMGRAMKAYAVV